MTGAEPAAGGVDGRGPDDDVPAIAPVWQRPQTLGYHEALRGIGGIVAPLLAGFSLAAIATIVTAESKPWLADWSVAALTAAVILLLIAMQVALVSLSYNSFPADILTWRPEITMSDAELQRARLVQASDLDETTRLGRISFMAYSGGLLAFHAALLMLIIPSQWSDGWIVAVALAGAALAFELWWIIANNTNLPHPIERPVLLSHRDPWSPSPDGQARFAVIDPAKEAAARAAAPEEP